MLCMQLVYSEAPMDDSIRVEQQLGDEPADRDDVNELGTSELENSQQLGNERSDTKDAQGLLVSFLSFFFSFLASFFFSSPLSLLSIADQSFAVQMLFSEKNSRVSRSAVTVRFYSMLSNCSCTRDLKNVRMMNE